MSRFQRLDVPSWVRYDGDGGLPVLGTKFHPEVPPVFGRDGWYFDRRSGTTWVEYQGRGYQTSVSDPERFRYAVQVCHPERVPRDRVLGALRILRQERVLVGKLLEQLKNHEAWLWLRQIRRGL